MTIIYDSGEAKPRKKRLPRYEVQYLYRSDGLWNTNDYYSTIWVAGYKALGIRLGGFRVRILDHKGAQ